MLSHNTSFKLFIGQFGAKSALDLMSDRIPHGFIHAVRPLREVEPGQWFGD
jgi:hypothetical protein